MKATLVIYNLFHPFEKRDNSESILETLSTILSSTKSTANFWWLWYMREVKLSTTVPSLA